MFPRSKSTARRASENSTIYYCGLVYLTSISSTPSHDAEIWPRGGHKHVKILSFKAFITCHQTSCAFALSERNRSTLWCRPWPRGSNWSSMVLRRYIMNEAFLCSTAYVNCIIGCDSANNNGDSQRFIHLCVVVITTTRNNRCGKENEEKARLL